MLKEFIKKLQPSSTLKINETSRQLEEKGKKIFKFGFGQSPFQVPTDIVNELKKMLTRTNIYQCRALVICENLLQNIRRSKKI